MSTISTSSIDAQTLALNTLSEALKKLVREFLETVQYESIADLRIKLLEFLEPLLGEATDIAAAYAAEAYDALRYEAVGSMIGSTAYSGRVSEATEKAVRAFLQKVVDGKYEEFINLVLERVDYEIKQSAANSTIHNASRDPLKPRFARIPTGSETCEFCIMLASRGFVYHSKESAGALNHWHPNCDCRVVAGFDGMEVDGYDPDALYEQYMDNLRTGKLKLKAVSKETSHTVRWESKQFQSVGDFTSFLRQSKDIGDLQQRCAIVEQEFPNTGLSDKYYTTIKLVVQEMKDKLIKSVA